MSGTDRRTGRLRIAAMAIAATVVPAVAGFALAAPGDGPIDLLSTYELRVDGETAGDELGWAVASAGDVNGDGRADVIVGSLNADYNGRTNSGSAYVVYGGSNATTLDLATLGARGFRIDGADTEQYAGYAVSAAGDVNGDGVDDVIVGAFNAGYNARDTSGSAYVVYGHAASDVPDVDLAALGGRGFRIDGAGQGDLAGSAVAGAGDVNGDGRDDVLVGAPRNAGMGKAYVVYGGSGPAAVDLAALGDRGFAIAGSDAYSQAGRSLDGVGDVNGDGRDDIVVGAWMASENDRHDSGSAYVVYGQTAPDPDDVTLGALGDRGFRVDGAAPFDAAGSVVAGAGDVNGDGHPDLLVSADDDPYGRDGAGSMYVVYGRAAADPGDVDLGALGDRGFRIGGPAAKAAIEIAGDGAGDVDGDGFADLVIGSARESNNGRAYSGSAYIVHGTADSGDVDLATLGDRGLRIDGAAASDATGVAVAGAGDPDGDGLDEVLVGAPHAGNNGRLNSGSTYLVGIGAPGTPTPTPTPTATASPTPTPQPPHTIRGDQAFVLGTANDLYLACTKLDLYLIDVLPAGRRVSVTGAADLRLGGQAVEIRLDGRRVATATIGAGGAFAANVAAPRASRRATARYQAVVGGTTSQRLRLARRMVATTLTRAGDKLVLRGIVNAPRSRRQPPIAVDRLLSCRRRQALRVPRVIPDRRGRFSVRFPVPAGARSAIYRAHTNVPVRAGRPASKPTFTLPRAIDLG